MSSCSVTSALSIGQVAFAFALCLRRTERISPAFVRVALKSPAFEDLGIDGPTPDSNGLPRPTGQLPGIHAQPEEWYPHGHAGGHHVT